MEASSQLNCCRINSFIKDRSTGFTVVHCPFPTIIKVNRRNRVKTRVVATETKPKTIEAKSSKSVNGSVNGSSVYGANTRMETVSQKIKREWIVLCLIIGV
ncbi:uncharacterized protein LOC118481105 [Helianthus annuus]|uniref:uncharacterized protein LOC118481105 n=1 Tax=Helianthus annuus TaxID=4232 RepID=UPI001652F5A6|nr:uncharacterized protein LOC118481105 [Helianthus annuus]